MGNCATLRQTPEYTSQRTPGAVPPPEVVQAAAAAADKGELNLGSGELPPGSPTNRTRKTHIQFIVTEVGGIPRKSQTLEKLSTKNGYFCEVWYENDGSKSLIYRTLTRAPDMSEKSTSIEFNPSSATTPMNKFGENVVVVPKEAPKSDTKLPPSIRIQVYASYLETAFSEGMSRLIGETIFPVAELQAKREWCMWMFHPVTECLVFDRVHNGTPLYVKISVPDGAPIPTLDPPAKRCVMITRGTRGDVQPFVALARGLAETKNWSVTIITEMRYRDLVIKNSTVSRGSIHFRPSGGDTESRIDRPLARWFIMQDNAAFQLLMLARAEREFFESEPAFSYFTRDARPDYLLFGFNTANIALVISESFRLPICGFILQPTIIPSKQYPAIVPVGSAEETEKTMTSSFFENIVKRNRRFSWSTLTLKDSSSSSGSAAGGDEQQAKNSPSSPQPLEPKTNNPSSPTEPSGDKAIQDTTINKDDTATNWTRCDLPAVVMENSSTATSTMLDTSHSVISVLKPLMENNIFTSRVNAMRHAHGLGPQRGEDIDFKVIQTLNVPMLCPINSSAFGGRPADWNPCISLTDFIFLSPTASQGASDGNAPLDPIKLLAPKLQKFIADAKEAKAPIVAIGFSSMPVSRTAILGLSSLVAEKAGKNVRVIALVGVRPSNEVTDAAEESRAQSLKDAGRLLEIGGAPFGILFPFCDFLIVHGGLGTTGEALRAGKPCLVTGVLLFDQRFWGRRIYELGCGPKPVHIKNLKAEIVKIVEKGLTPGNPWAENARKMAQTLKEGGHGDGIAMNVTAIAEACERTALSFAKLPSWQSARKVLMTENAPEIEQALVGVTSDATPPSPAAPEGKKVTEQAPGAVVSTQ